MKNTASTIFESKRTKQVMCEYCQKSKGTTFKADSLFKLVGIGFMGKAPKESKVLMKDFSSILKQFKECRQCLPDDWPLYTTQTKHTSLPESIVPWLHWIMQWIFLWTWLWGAILCDSLRFVSATHPNREFENLCSLCTDIHGLYRPKKFSQWWRGHCIPFGGHHYCDTLSLWRDIIQQKVALRLMLPID